MTTAQQAWEEWDALAGDVGCGAAVTAWRRWEAARAGETAR